ncbi:MAG: phosphatidate cytidylyltransferase [Acutalibacteraceae bacterium]|jgi:phosphatidate cytidylyltransferase|nr:phosphatidate cytidylyltransferase [Acutalibacteraceae bacterium]
MKDRIFSGIILIIFFLAIIVFNRSFPLALNIAIALISALAVYEVIKALGLSKRWYITAPSLATAVLVQFCEFQDANLYIYAAFTACVFGALLANHREISFKEIAVVYSMVVIIPLGLQTIVLVRGLHAEHGMFYALICVFAAWIPDAGAFFVGKLFGKHKLCPEISPKKTVEGLIGGVVSSIVILELWGWIFAEVFYGGTRQIHLLTLFVIGLFGSLVSVLGDLSFSLIKRSCHIKDFGNVIPGHGGVLDRFDSVIFTAPFVYLVLRLLPMVS